MIIETTNQGIPLIHYNPDQASVTHLTSQTRLQYTASCSTSCFQLLLLIKALFMGFPVVSPTS